jgi:hypothetical protein
VGTESAARRVGIVAPQAAKKETDDVLQNMD